MSQSASDKRVLTRWRREFPIPKSTTFLNNASFGPVPISARKAIEALFRKQSEFKGNPDVDGETFSLLDESRRMFASLVNANPARVAFAPNASFGLNAILHGLELKRGERVLVPANEFPAVVYAVRSLCEKSRLSMIPINCSRGAIDHLQLQSELERGAAVLAMSWIQYFNGYRNELRAISDLCHKHSCFVLADVTQGAGVVPFDMMSDQVDAIACGTQKWLLGQTGGGFFAIAESPRREVTPLYAGWLGFDWDHSWADLQRWDQRPLPDGRVWEVGTYPFYSVRMVHAGLRILTACGVERVYRHVLSLHQTLIDGLQGTPYTPVIFPEPSNQSAIITFAGPDTSGLHRYLLNKRVYVSLREGNIRVSPHFYNTYGDIERLCRLVRTYSKVSN